MEDKKAKCKSRLLVGEGDFSYTLALLNKHSDKPLARAIIATEYNEQKFYHTESAEGGFERSRPLSERIEKLRLMGVAVEFNVDATKIDRHFEGRRFERIHWNCPYRAKPSDCGVESLSVEDSGLVIRFRNVVPKFFQAAGKLQSVGDRVHVSLNQDEGHGAEQWENPIVLATVLSNYRLIKKRLMNETRYPGYVHILSSGALYDLGGVEREYVFEKLPDPDDACPQRFLAVVKTLRNMDKAHRSLNSIEKEPVELEEFDQVFRSSPALKSSSSSFKKKFFVKKRKFASTPADLTDYQYECSTDEDSSDYWDSSDDSSSEKLAS